LAKSDDNIDWDYHWLLHESDADFTDVSFFSFFADLLPKGFRVLDVGCGSCRFYPVFKALGCSQYVGVDFSPKAVSLARQKFPEITVHQMKVQDIDFDSTFDLVFSNTFLQHTSLESKKRIIPKLWKALKNGGLLAIIEKSDVDTPTTFTRENWIKFIEQYGFKYVRGKDPDGFVFKALKPNTLQSDLIDNCNYDQYRYLMFILPIIKKAKIIVETGLGQGNSTIIFLEACRFLGDCKLYTFEININKEDTLPARKRISELGLEPWWTLVEKDSVQAGREWNHEKIDVLFLDSHHSYEHVKAELEAFKPHLSEKAVILCHDTNPKEEHEMYKTGGPLKALKEFQTENPNWKLINLKANNGMGVLVRFERSNHNSS